MLYLEATNRNAAMSRVSKRPNKGKVKLIQKFAHLLPGLDNKMQQLTEIFETLFEKRKHFKTYVCAKLKVEQQDIISLETFRDIKIYAPQCILEVMDWPLQSLNQVSQLDSTDFFTLSF
jgi:hypothetical protein